MPAPVVIFVYNRPDHTKKTIEALAENYLAKETDVFIFSDGAKNEKDIANVQMTRKYIESIPDKNLFKSVEIIKASKNKGLANSVINGVTEIIEKFREVIVLEDDLVTSKDFLQYMNGALDYYKNNESIWSISGYNLPIDIPPNYNHDIYLSYRGCSWGWATWKDRWDKVDWDVKDYQQFRKSRKLRNEFNRGGRDLADMLDLQMQGKIDSWAIRWCYAQFKYNMLTVYPVKSRIMNIGLDGSGTHSGNTNHYDIVLNRDNKKCKFEEVKIHEDITKMFQNHYMSLSDYYIFQFKKIVKKILGR